MTTVRPSDALWKEGAYYSESPAHLRENPILPDPRRLRDRRIVSLFDRYAGVAPGRRVLEVGCGRSPWLPFLALHRRCEVAGIDIEPFAAELARANLAGVGASGLIVCRDAFRVEESPDLRGRFELVYSMGVMEHFEDAVSPLRSLASYLEPGGRILTTVPNLRGVNWLLQALGSREILEMHVVYDTERLVGIHEAAGFRTIAAGYVGFFDGYLTSSAALLRRARSRLHAGLCRGLGLLSEAWVRLGRGHATPELPWCSPFVFYVGQRPRGGGDPPLHEPPRLRRPPPSPAPR